MFAKAETQNSEVLPWDTGTIKWFDITRRYGFITTEDGDEVFLPWTVLQESNIPERAMKIGTPIRYRCTPPEGPGRRPRATQVALMAKAR